MTTRPSPLKCLSKRSTIVTKEDVKYVVLVRIESTANESLNTFFRISDRCRSCSSFNLFLGLLTLTHFRLIKKLAWTLFNVGLILVPIRLEAPSLDPISIEFNPCLNFNSVESDLVMREIFDRLANIQTRLFTKSVSPLLFDECLAWPTFRQFMLELLQKSTHSGTVRPKIQISKLWFRLKWTWLGKNSN